MKPLIFCVDAESDGLYGCVWAIAAIVADASGNELDRFIGQIDTSFVTHAWTRENAVPYVHLPMYPSARALRDAFWDFWMRYRETAECIAYCGHPVEDGLFIACVQDDWENRNYK